MIGCGDVSTTRATPIEIASNGALERVSVGDPEHVQQPMIQSIVDELNGTDECPSTGRTALRQRLPAVRTP
jgi:hypothetical protein